MAKIYLPSFFLICLFTAAILSAETMPAKPVSVDVTKDGGIVIVFSDHHQEIVSKDKTSARPHISSKGDVGWSTWNDTNSSGMGHSGETLHVRLADGSIKDFKPNSRFILNWNFVDKGAAIVIASMGYHGSDFFIKYDLGTGKVLGQVDHYESEADLPDWARPFSDS